MYCAQIQSNDAIIIHKLLVIQYPTSAVRGRVSDVSASSPKS